MDLSERILDFVARMALKLLNRGIGHDFIQRHLPAKYVNRIGWSYYYGRYTQQDYYQAFEWYAHAADRLYPPAMYNMGICLNFGHGIDQNYQMAEHFFKAAADRGDADSQFNLAIYYLKGTAGPKDEKLFLEWLEKAAQQDQENALNLFGDLYRRGEIVGEKNIPLALDYYKRSAEKGFALATINLMSYYKLENDRQNAERWFYRFKRLPQEDVEGLLQSLKTTKASLEKSLETIEDPSDERNLPSNSIVPF